MPRPERLAGVDVARALAVLGMFAVHLGVGSVGLLGGDAAETFHSAVRGNSAGLFAFLAGLSLALMTGRAVPVSGHQLHRQRVRVVTRAFVLALLGGALDVLGAPVAVILTYYGGFFLLAAPLLRLRAGLLSVLAAVVAAAGPQVSFVVRDALGESDPYRASSFGGVGDLLVTGYYPACTFMAFVLAGMAVGRLDLRSRRVRAGMVASGAVLTALGYGLSWVLLYPGGGADRLLAQQVSQQHAMRLSEVDPALLGPMREWLGDQMADLHGQVPTDSAWWLVVASPHSGTSFEIAAVVGTSLVVLAMCLLLADVAGPLLYPVAAVGAMALTVYASHIAVMAWQDMSSQDTAPWRLELFLAGAVVLATGWRLAVGRGPLEWGIARLADVGERLAATRW